MIKEFKPNTKYRSLIDITGSRSKGDIIISLDKTTSYKLWYLTKSGYERSSDNKSSFELINDNLNNYEIY